MALNISEALQELDPILEHVLGRKFKFSLGTGNVQEMHLAEDARTMLALGMTELKKRAAGLFENKQGVLVADDIHAALQDALDSHLQSTANKSQFEDTFSALTAETYKKTQANYEKAPRNVLSIFTKARADVAGIGGDERKPLFTAIDEVMPAAGQFLKKNPGTHRVPELTGWTSPPPISGPSGVLAEIEQFFSQKLFDHIIPRTVTRSAKPLVRFVGLGESLAELEQRIPTHTDRNNLIEDLFSAHFLRGDLPEHENLTQARALYAKMVAHYGDLSPETLKKLPKAEAANITKFTKYLSHAISEYENTHLATVEQEAEALLNGTGHTPPVTPVPPVPALPSFSQHHATLQALHDANPFAAFIPAGENLNVLPQKPLIPANTHKGMIATFEQEFQQASDVENATKALLNLHFLNGKYPEAVPLLQAHEQLAALRSFYNANAANLLPEKKQLYNELIEANRQARAYFEQKHLKSVTQEAQEFIFERDRRPEKPSEFQQTLGHAKASIKKLRGKLPKWMGGIPPEPEVLTPVNKPITLQGLMDYDHFGTIIPAGFDRTTEPTALLEHVNFTQPVDAAKLAASIDAANTTAELVPHIMTRAYHEERLPQAAALKQLLAEYNIVAEPYLKLSAEEFQGLPQAEQDAFNTLTRNRDHALTHFQAANYRQAVSEGIQLLGERHGVAIDTWYNPRTWVKDKDLLTNEEIAKIETRVAQAQQTAPETASTGKSGWNWNPFKRKSAEAAVEETAEETDKLGNTLVNGGLVLGVGGGAIALSGSGAGGAMAATATVAAPTVGAPAMAPVYALPSQQGSWVGSLAPQSQQGMPMTNPVSELGYSGANPGIPGLGPQRRI